MQFISTLKPAWRLALAGGLLGGLGVLALAGGPATARPTPAPDARLAARRALGHLLFFEPALSANGKRSCASCHRPEKAFCDQRSRARALRFADNLDRNSPTLLNAAGQATFFHDGRAGSLRAVLTAVLTSPREFGSTYAQATARLGGSAEYRRRFRQAFGAGAAIDSTTLAAALEAWVSTLAGQNAAYDQAQRGGPALDTAAQAGVRVFAAAGCARCHAGPLFRDGRRYEVRPGRWIKTPTLRNVALTMPYGADGNYATLASALRSPFHARQQAQPLTDGQTARLEALLVALTDTVVGRSAVPARLPRVPGLEGRAVGGLY